MPFTVNGIGTSICPAGGFVRWGGRWTSEADCDSLECLTIFYLPVVPYRAVHTFDWQGNRYRQIPIRGSVGLFVRGIIRRWLWAFVFGAFIAGIFALVGTTVTERVVGGSLVLLFGLAAPLGFWLMAATDRRNCNIRRLLGRHELGSSDPATWPDNLLDKLVAPAERFGSDSYAEAVDQLRRAKDYSGAMWAARLTAAVENRTLGEEMTDELLSEPEVRDLLEEIKRDPKQWPTLVQRGTSPAAPSS